jgi:micrococcal nuclease
VEKMIILVIVLLLVGIIISKIVASANMGKWNVPKGLKKYKIVRVIDGDTIVVAKLGNIRLIGVNTPESKVNRMTGEQYYGEKASRFAKKLLEGKTVKLEFDEGREDKYGRILAYVYLDKIFVNALLVKKGYAKVLSMPPNVRYKKLFQTLEKEAKAKRKGLWKKAS